MQAKTNPMYPILLVDDEPQALESVAIALEIAGYDNVIRCRDPREAMGQVQDHGAEVVLLDLIMPRLSGEDILERLRLEEPDVPVVVTTGVDAVDTAVRCMQKGAFDYITKPVDRDRLVASVRRAVEFRALRRENSLLSQHLLTDALANPEPFADIVTANKRMRAIFQYCEAVAQGREPVLVSGETGTGKELVAHALHRASGRAGEFVAVNVAGLDDQAFSDTLFGHTKGAFTGAADKAKKGKFELADKGTLFLDEIGDIPGQSQIKLLRVLQEREFRPLGSDTARSMDARVVVATHRDVRELVESGALRQDFYFRLRTHHVQVPPLRERRDDIPLLLDHFLDLAAGDFGKKTPVYPPELPVLLGTYHFPGNVRELRSMIYDAVGKHASKMLSMAVFKEHIAQPWGAAPGMAALEQDEGPPFGHLVRLPTLKQAAEALVDEALQRAEGNQRIAASILGITPQALSKRLKQRG